MEENNENWEQPETSAKEIDGSQEQSEAISKEENETAQKSEAEKGVTIGKFKSVEALFDAYNNLEKEFTKKSQRLSELEKDKAQENEDYDGLIDGKFKAFLSTNGEAEEYADMLKQKVRDDATLKKMDDPFSYVWAGIVFDKLKSKDGEEKGDSIISNYILQNSSVKDMVIKNYISKLNTDSASSPIKIASAGDRVAINTTKKPANLKEAKSVLFDLFC